jgi:hypothetical protein
MYEPKDINVSMAIVVTDKNSNKINETLKHNYNYYCKYNKILITNNKKIDYYNNGEKYHIYETNSYQILENYDIAMKNCNTEWCFLLQAGTYLTKNLIKKLSMFIFSDKDIIFPVKNRVYDFIKNPLNGLLINKNTYNNIGVFGKDNPEDIIKLLWAADAVKFGCTFKAIVGCKI